jgi:predicted nucleic acid-binding protein
MCCNNGNHIMRILPRCLALHRQIEVYLPGHAITTIHYVVSKMVSTAKADAAVDWLLAHFDVIALDQSALLRARSLPMSDFEDTVVASLALVSQCDYIVTRNTVDFQQAPVPAILPAQLLILIEKKLGEG